PHMQIIWWPRLLNRASSPLVAKTLSSATHNPTVLNSRFAKAELTLISRSCFLADSRRHNARRYRTRTCYGRRSSARDQRDRSTEENEEGANPDPPHQRIDEHLDDWLVRAGISPGVNYVQVFLERRLIGDDMVGLLA